MLTILGGTIAGPVLGIWMLIDRKSTRLNSSHANIYTLPLPDALPIYRPDASHAVRPCQSASHADDTRGHDCRAGAGNLDADRSEEHTSELQSRQYLHSSPTRRSSDLSARREPRCPPLPIGEPC